MSDPAQLGKLLLRLKTLAFVSFHNYDNIFRGGEIQY